MNRRLVDKYIIKWFQAAVTVCSKAVVIPADPWSGKRCSGLPQNAEKGSLLMMAATIG